MAGDTARKERLVSAHIPLTEGRIPIPRACVPPWGWMGVGGGGTTREGAANEHAYVCALPPPASPRKFHPFSHGMVVFMVSIPAWWLGEGERGHVELTKRRLWLSHGEERQGYGCFAQFIAVCRRLKMGAGGTR